MKEKFIPGQRWYSESEPELGLGSVIAADSRNVEIKFPNRNITRSYATETAPLRRLQFSIGDSISSIDGRSMIIEKLEDKNGLLIYKDSDKSIHESLLSESIDFTGSEERLIMGIADSNEIFNLRFLAITKRNWLQMLPVRGLLGARISLLPHQLYVVSEIASRYHIRVMLGDEVGLGKTIEAGLILSRQLLLGVATRILIILPESLTHQWFLELWRRFNLTFSIFDEERCSAIQTSNSEINPFSDSSLVICSLTFLVKNPKRMKEICDIDWDILVIDEAHHLQWAEGNPSTEYQLVENLSKTVPSVLLLSGTPEQLGEEGHFARLHLLDPKRFYDLQKFKGEQINYTAVASVINKLLSGESLSTSEQENLSKNYHYDPKRLVDLLQRLTNGDTHAQKQLISELVDHHGTGRLFYRNQRNNIAGFPKRKATFYPVKLNDKCASIYDPSIDSILPEFQVSKKYRNDWWQHDLRLTMIIDILNKNPYEKILLICSSPKTVQAIQNEIEQKISIRMAVFHEGLSLIVRDRNAAYFADPDGARLLICSEIGSEGRNFQFCHHLLLFDLPENPELLEQRIGRLARIGQMNNVTIHVIYLEQTFQEVLAKWYGDGLNAFCKPLQGANKLYQELGNKVHKFGHCWFDNGKPEELKKLIDDTKRSKDDIVKKMAAGRDRLLEWHSHQPSIGEALVDEVESIEAHSNLSSFMDSVCNHIGIQIEDHDHNSLFYLPGDHYHGLPGLPDAGLPVTFSRQRAIAREDYTFLTWEHPMVTGAIDQLIGSADGRSSYGVWEDQNSRIIYVEAIFIIHSLAPEDLRPDRFLAATPLRIMVSHDGADVSSKITHKKLKEVLKDDNQTPLLKKTEVTQQLLPHLTKRSRELAEIKKNELVKQAISAMRSTIQPEIDRLSILLAAKAPIREEEITHLRDEFNRLENYFIDSVIKLDAIRLIWRGPTT